MIASTLLLGGQLLAPRSGPLPVVCIGVPARYCDQPIPEAEVAEYAERARVERAEASCAGICTRERRIVIVELVLDNGDRIEYMRIFGP
jgi:hypothetical protein